ncbi:hypothetical protein [Shewanella sp. UCD-KL21]|uniref:hypothetical protein n=1 Tax=Shewanella sp. UCD-KL21 TaxID=1917164 RepID=UPI0009705160|nr:hypothetical protein [Shewanella sp. UCD-KL21]
MAKDKPSFIELYGHLYHPADGASNPADGSFKPSEGSITPTESADNKAVGAVNHTTVNDKGEYTNHSLGVSFTKPAGWHFMSLKPFTASSSSQALSQSRFTKNLINGEEPIVVMSQINAQYNRTMGPSISVYAEPFTYQKGESLHGLVKGFEALYKKGLKQYKILSIAKEFKISHCDSIEYTSQFLFKAAWAEKITRNRCLISVNEPIIFTFNMIDVPKDELDKLTHDDPSANAQIIFDQFKASIRYF